MPKNKRIHAKIQTIDGTDRLFTIQELIKSVPAGFKISGIKKFVQEHTGITPTRFDHLRFAKVHEPRMIKYDEALLLAHVFDVSPLELFNVDYETILKGTPKIIELNYRNYT